MSGFAERHWEPGEVSLFFMRHKVITGVMPPNEAILPPDLWREKSWIRTAKELIKTAQLTASQPWRY